MAAVRQVVELSDKEIRDALIERAKLAINNGKADGPVIQGSSSLFISVVGKDGTGNEITFNSVKADYSAQVTFERPGGK